MGNKPLVSVVCAAYNHEKYIRKALESFVAQQTDFEFEVIVHDDASTDATADIIREFEEKWPNIIKPIYQTVNQHSKGLSVNLQFMYPKSQGEYIAICEGDDYWTDPQKLQKQYDYMQEHPDCPLCAHETIRIFEDGRYQSRFTNHDFSAPDKCYLTAEEVITHVNDFHTSSLFYRRSFLDKNKQFLETVPVFDYVTKILCATDLSGAVYVIPQVMSAYRMSSTGSWSQRVRDNAGRYQKHLSQSIDTLRKIDAYREFRYTDAINEEITKRQFSIDVSVGNKAAWKDPRYKSLIGQMTTKEKMVNYFQLHMPRKVYDWLRQTYSHIKKYIEG